VRLCFFSLPWWLTESQWLRMGGPGLCAGVGERLTLRPLPFPRHLFTTTDQLWEKQSGARTISASFTVYQELQA
jgi:hypothetical protein